MTLLLRKANEATYELLEKLEAEPSSVALFPHSGLSDGW